MADQRPLPVVEYHNATEFGLQPSELFALARDVLVQFGNGTRHDLQMVQNEGSSTAREALAAAGRSAGTSSAAPP